MQKHLLSLLSLLFLIGCPTYLSGQCEEWIWANDVQNYVQNDLSIDQDENTYLALEFLFDSINVSGTTLYNTQQSFKRDGAIIKYDPSGQVAWTTLIGGNNSQAATVVKATPTGKVLVAGYMDDTLRVNGMSYPIDTASNNSKDVFLMQLNSITGAVEWVKTIRGEEDDVPKAIGWDENGAIYLGGDFESLNFGIDNVSLSIYSDEDPFIMKFDGNGNAIWGRVIRGLGRDLLYDMAVTPNGTVAFTAYYNYSLDIGNVTIPQGNNYVIGGFDSQGNVAWAEALDNGLTFRYDNGRLAATSDNHFFLTGTYQNELNIRDSSLEKNGYIDYLVKLSDTGEPVWLTHTDAPIPDNSINFTRPDVEVDKADNVYWIPHIDITESSIFSHKVPYPEGQSFTVKYDRYGNLIWANAKLGTTRGVAAGNDNNFAVWGISWVPSIRFGAVVVTGANYNAYMIHDEQEVLLEDFDSQPICRSEGGDPNGICAALEGGWINDVDNDVLDWSIGDANTVHMAGTGPDAPKRSNQYMYFNPSGTDIGDDAHLIRSCIDISKHAHPTLFFYYHMFGDDIGSLHLDIYTDGTWAMNVWSAEGQQQLASSDKWRRAQIDLNSIPNDGTIGLRFRAVSLEGAAGIIGLDEVFVWDSPGCELVGAATPSQTIAEGESVILSATLTGAGANFQSASLTVVDLSNFPGFGDPSVIETTWYQGAEIIGGGTGTPAAIFVTPESAITYDLVADNFYCAYFDQTTITIAPPTSIDPNELYFASLSLFPNPASEQVNLSLSLDSPESLQMTLQNTQGQIVWESIERVGQQANTFTIPLDGAPTGIYFLQLRTEDHQITKKLVVR